MCSTGAVMALQATGGIMQAQGQIKDGNSTNSYYRHMADLSEQQAELTKIASDRKISYIQEQAARDSVAVNNRARQVEGAQKVALAANGVGAGSSTAEDLALDSMNKEKLDELAVRYSAELSSFETQKAANVEALGLQSQAVGYRAAGKQAKTAAKVNAFNTLLGTATSMSSTAYQAKQYQPIKAKPTPEKEPKTYIPKYLTAAAGRGAGMGTGSKLNLKWPGGRS